MLMSLKKQQKWTLFNSKLRYLVMGAISIGILTTSVLTPNRLNEASALDRTKPLLDVSLNNPIVQIPKKGEYSKFPRLIGVERELQALKRYPLTELEASPLFITVLIVSGSFLIVFAARRQRKQKHGNQFNNQRGYVFAAWINCSIPEDWQGNLEALRSELIAAKMPNWRINLILMLTFLDMLSGGIRVKLQDLLSGSDAMATTGQRSITSDKDNSTKPERFK
jgi:hypothetical protein